MKLKQTILLVVVASLFAMPSLAQENVTNTVSFNGFSFSFDSTLAPNVNVSQFAGDPVDAQQPGGPEVRNTEFDLYSQLPAPGSFDAPGVIRVYHTADFGSYVEQATRFQQLQTLLAERPDLSSFMTIISADESQPALPFLPVLGASQVVRARVQYVDTANVRGISYITAYRQDASPFVSRDFVYTFQGVSADGMSYVSAIFPLMTNLFPAEIAPDFNPDTFMAGMVDYLNQSVGQLNQALPTDFTPSLATMDAVIQSFAFQPMTPGEVVPVATATSSDPTLGGLGGITWNLISYGSSDSPQAVLPEAPITLTLGLDGIGGSSGCNTYGGGFQYDAGSIAFTNIVSTLVACEGAGVMDQEMAYLNALNSAGAFQLGNGQLQIAYDGGVLNFTSAALPLNDLGGVTWNLVSFGSADSSAAVLPEAPITLTFTADGAAGGIAGCNTYGGSYQSGNGAILFSNIASTLVACEGAGIMDQETAYLGALNSATSYQVANGQLQIAYNGGVLTFVAGA